MQKSIWVKISLCNPCAPKNICRKFWNVPWLWLGVSCVMFSTAATMYGYHYFILLIRNIIDKLLKCFRQVHSQTMNTMGASKFVVVAVHPLAPTWLCSWF